MQGASRLPNSTIYVVEPGYLGECARPGLSGIPGGKESGKSNSPPDNGLTLARSAGWEAWAISSHPDPQSFPCLCTGQAEGGWAKVQPVTCSSGREAGQSRVGRALSPGFTPGLCPDCIMAADAGKMSWREEGEGWRPREERRNSEPQRIQRGIARAQELPRGSIQSVDLLWSQGAVLLWI